MSGGRVTMVHTLPNAPGRMVFSGGEAVNAIDEVHAEAANAAARLRRGIPASAAAHVDSRLTGIGPFSRLRDVPSGAPVAVTDADGTVHRYRVTDVESIDKDSAPLDVWFARSGPPRLVLVTCGGTWQEDVGHYSDNVVVTAEPVTG